MQLILLFELLVKVAGQCKNITANVYTATPFTFFSLYAKVQN
jgi:hypothetical protein